MHFSFSRFSRLVLIAGMFAAPLVLHAAALDQFKSFVAGTQSAKGEFSQRLVRSESAAKPGATATPAVKVSTPSTGTFLFARPGKFIWTYLKPYEQVLQADGDKLFIYDKDLNQVTSRKLGNAIGSSPAAILFGSNDLEKNFTLKEAGTREGVEWLDAIPKSKDTTFEHIGIGLRDGVPVAMELRDTFGQTSVLTFTRFERNPVLAADQFKFVIPKGADVNQQ
ncbi:Outer membrane lipoprotein carrier protein LolA [Oxalobacteraceae bacterium IMCC9480]|jgi:outer membrane lipoprotein carrier protein|nr:Outer membrane lipoprotein carrier protein LolA [Oxalobacteraceae bacterium IMCC9480]NDP60966.1 outer membrane lipoprotein chaperone LolA [Oxalobacteraceae bacterium]